MSFSVKAIIKAWAVSFNPTEDQKILAEARLEICNSCPAMTTIKGIKGCTLCGCPISKKVFTQSENPCPDLKWAMVDEGKFNTKKKKTIMRLWKKL